MKKEKPMAMFPTLEGDKLVSKTGATGTSQAIAGVVIALFPGIFSSVDQEPLLRVIGGAIALAGILVTIFRKKSDGKKPMIV